jgi:hypothetical protein
MSVNLGSVLILVDQDIIEDGKIKRISGLSPPLMSVFWVFSSYFKE